MGTLSLYDLRCEYAVNPLGIGTDRPRLSWKLAHPERGQVQSAYQVRCAHAPEALEEGGAELVWDSGVVPGANSVAVPYGGPLLASRERLYWQARAWDAQNREGPWSETAWFEAALLDPKDWQAVWIGCPPAWPGRAHYFRRRLVLPGAVARARLYAAGLGYHEFYLNGERLGTAELDPAYTDITRRVMYRTFDITPFLKPGANAFGAIVGNGWHGQPRLLAQVEITLQDGTELRTFTCAPGDDPLDDAWLVGPGPIMAHGIYEGEVYDAREEVADWNLPTEGAGASWSPGFHVADPGGERVAQMIEPIEAVAERLPRTITRVRPGVYVADFGQNMAGWVRLRVRGLRGRRVTLRFAEVLYPDGTVNQENLRAAAATDVYILRGGGQEVWEPSFTYHGFRYVQVEGYPGRPARAALTARVLRSAVEEAGQFACSHELLNRIHHLVRATEGSNLHAVPTDCPQRNERMGWLNDLAARAEESFYNFTMARFMPKWIGDIYAAQDPTDGGITNTAPWSWGPRLADPVSSCYLEIPWLLYAHYGDRRTLETYYDGFQRWLGCLDGLAREGIISYSLWGDWAPPLAQTVPGTPRNATAPPEVVSTAYYYYTARLLERIAGILGKGEDCSRYAEQAGAIAAAFDRRFWNEELGGYSTNSQSCNALALWMGLVSAERRERVLGNLVRDVLEEHDGHLTTGNVCTKYLLEALAANGRGDVALRLATQTSYPGWGYMLDNGATTLWERWELATGGGMNSHNHPMMGSVGSWLFKMLAGLRVTPTTVGFDTFELAPILAEGIDHLSVQHRTVRGPVSLAWRRAGGRVHLQAEVPVGSTAQLTIPTPDACARIDEGGACVWDAEGVANCVAGIRRVQRGPAGVIFWIGSGRYAFEFECR